MIWKSEIALVILSLAMARWHACLIIPTERYPKGRPIKHGWWGLLYCVFIALAAWWVWPHLHGNAWRLLTYGATQACSHLVVFNVSLNLFRGKKWDYVSEDTTSIIDRLEERLFGHRVWILEAVLTIAFFLPQVWLSGH